MIVDDSRTVRRVLHRWLSAIPGVAVVAECVNGREAVETIVASEAEVVVLDLEMPELNGLQALPKLIAAVSDLQVIIVSQLTKPNAEATLGALASGAADTILKPESLRGGESLGQFRRELTLKIRALGDGLRVRRGQTPPPALPAAQAIAPAPPPVRAVVALRPPSKAQVRVIGIGCSTGGPKALQDLLRGLALPLPVPVLVTQHMPAAFTTILAEQLERQFRVPCREGVDGEVIRTGRIYMAPGDKHMLLRRGEKGPVIVITTDPPENYCRPAVDPLFRSLAQVFGEGVLGLVLTGMGSDGLMGGRAIVEAGGTLMAQDEASSVVWGMPGAVATAGLCSAIEPVDALARRTHELVRRVSA